MYEGPNLHPGDRFTVIGPDGVAHHDTVHSIHYRSAEPEVLQRPTGWRKVLRNLTPKRRRKPLPVVRPYRPGGVEVIGISKVGRRAQHTLDDMSAAVDRLLNQP